METIKFKRTHEDAILPRKNYKNDACWDLFAVEDTIIPPNEYAVIPVGLSVNYIPKGYFIRVEARSGNGFKKHLYPHFGIIDNGYRGDLGIKMYNHSNYNQLIEKGKGVAQFSLNKIYHAEIEFSEDSINSDRGVNGFGSSDKN